MQAQGFGRKGGTVGGTMAFGQTTPARSVQPQAVPDDDPYAAARAAFLAQERANGGFDLADRNADLASAWSPTVANWRKSKTVAYLLWLFAGPVAAHRIYCARYLSAVIQSSTGLAGLAIMLTAFHEIATWGLLLTAHGLWRFIDLFLIPGMCDRPPGR